jgi:hypothetical protein
MPSSLNHRVLWQHPYRGQEPILPVQTIAIVKGCLLRMQFSDLKCQSCEPLAKSQHNFEERFVVEKRKARIGQHFTQYFRQHFTQHFTQYFLRL